MAEPSETVATPAEVTTTPPADDAGSKKSNHILETPADAPDPDEAELTAALAAEEAERVAAGGAPAAETPPAPTGETVVAPAADAATPPTGHVPVAAAQAERQKRQDAEDVARNATAQALYWKGVAEGRFPQPQQPGKTTEPPPANPANDRIKDLRGEQKKLAAEVDAGRLSQEEYEEKRGVLDDQIATIREDAVVSKVKDTTSDLYLATLTEQLDNENQWLTQVPEDELMALVPFAKKDLMAAGFDLNAHAGTPLGDFRLRQAVVERAKRFGYSGTAPAATGTEVKPGAAPATTMPTKEQLEAKQRLAAAAPPALSGTTAPASTWSEERVESMNSLDLETMSMADLRKVGEMIDREASTKRVSTVGRR